MGKVEDRLAAMGVQLPQPAIPAKVGGNFLTAARYGNLTYVSGSGDLRFIGKVGRDLTLEEGYDAARGATLYCLAALQKEVGTLDRVQKILKVLGFVNSAPGFVQQPAVLNGCSDLLVQVFGENGRHARSAIGTSDLPMGLAVEVEMFVIVD